MATIATSTLGATNMVEKTVKFVYDFDTHTGAVGDYLGAIIPKGAIITKAIGSAITNFNSDGSATVAFAVGSTAIKSATAYGDAAFKDIDTHSSTAVKLSADSQIKMSIATAALIAGKYELYITYLY